MRRAKLFVGCSIFSAVLATACASSGAFDGRDGERGMKAGGIGECQLSSGERIDAVFPPQ